MHANGIQWRSIGFDHLILAIKSECGGNLKLVSIDREFKVCKCPGIDDSESISRTRVDVEHGVLSTRIIAFVSRRIVTIENVLSIVNQGF